MTNLTFCHILFRRSILWQIKFGKEFTIVPALNWEYLLDDTWIPALFGKVWKVRHVTEIFSKHPNWRETKDLDPHGLSLNVGLDYKV